VATYVIRNIRFTVAGTDLAGDGVVAFSAPLQAVADVFALSGAAGIEAYDRGGAMHSVSVSVLRKHANDDALEAFIVGHPASVTRQGALVVTTGTATTTTKTASKACITAISIAEPEALLTVTTYSITCSPLL
jgi:hypothetical protein